MNPEKTSTNSSPAQVCSFVAEALGITDVSKVVESARFVEDLGADSLDRVEMIMGAEEHFAIEIDDQSAEKIQTVGDMIQYIQAAQNIGTSNSGLNSTQSA